ncbi:MAG TPA: alpha/beta fold hydrolase [Phytomonospora sp.]
MLNRRPVEGAFTLTTDDGVHLDAVHLPGRGPSELAIVVAHGFTGTWRSARFRNIMEILRAHGAVVSFQFRGHGRSGGGSTLGDREVLDVDAAVAHVRELGYRQVALLGFSMGSAVVVRYAGLYGDVSAVAAVSGPSRWYYKGTASMRWVHRAVEWPVGRLVSRSLLHTRIADGGWAEEPVPPWRAAAMISPIPLLIVHGDQDRYFPLRHAYELHHAAGEPKELWIEKGVGHAEAGMTPPIVRRIGNWLSEHAKG